MTRAPALRALAGLLLPLLVLPACRADDGDGGGGAPPAGPREAVTAFRAALEVGRETLHLGELEVSVVAVADLLLHRAASVYLDEALDGQSPAYGRERLARLAAEEKDRAGPGLLLTFRHEGAKDDDFYAIQGLPDDCVLVRAGGKLRTRVVGHAGQLPLRELTLFKANLAAAFAREANLMPVIRRSYRVFQADPFRLDLVLARPPGKKAERLDVALGGVIHFSGRIRSNQADFEHGAHADPLPPATVSFPLPFPAPEPPPALAELLPAR